MELELIKATLKKIEKDGWYKLILQFNLKTIELFLKPVIEIKADNPITLASTIGDTLSTLVDFTNYVVDDK